MKTGDHPEKSRETVSTQRREGVGAALVTHGLGIEAITGRWGS